MLGLIFVSPFLLLLVLFTLSNATPVQLGLWPTDLSVQAPLSIAVLVVSAVFFVLGALVVGLGSLAQRRRARRRKAACGRWRRRWRSSSSGLRRSRGRWSGSRRPGRARRGWKARL